jgi:hypothetical protein
MLGHRYRYEQHKSCSRIVSRLQVKSLTGSLLSLRLQICIACFFRFDLQNQSFKKIPKRVGLTRCNWVDTTTVATKANRHLRGRGGKCKWRGRSWNIQEAHVRLELTERNENSGLSKEASPYCFRKTARQETSKKPVSVHYSYLLLVNTYRRASDTS